MITGLLFTSLLSLTIWRPWPSSRSFPISIRTGRRAPRRQPRRAADHDRRGQTIGGIHETVYMYNSLSPSWTIRTHRIEYAWRTNSCRSPS